jgi:hypothetical protein
VRTRAWCVTVALAALAGCGSNPTVAACPGDRVATLHFRGTLGADSTCAFDADPVSFDATLAYGAGGTAVLCLTRAEADPLRGTHDGDHVTVSAPAASVAPSGCGCTVAVSETIDATLTRLDAGAVTVNDGDGTLTDELAPGGGTTPCAPQCVLPCRLRWTLTASP